MKRALCSLLGQSVLLALALGICGVAMAASSSARSGSGGAHCGPVKARTLASSAEARVYALHRIVYGCAGKRQFRLGRYVHPVAVAGRLVAYGKQIGGYDFVWAYVRVRNLADGKRLFDSPAITDDPRAEPIERVASLVAAQGGHVAWIAVSTGIGGPSHRIVEVHRRDTVLDSGPRIHPRSLKLHGSLLSWKHGSKTRTARLR